MFIIESLTIPHKQKEKIEISDKKTSPVHSKNHLDDPR